MKRKFIPAGVAIAATATIALTACATPTVAPPSSSAALSGGAVQARAVERELERNASLGIPGPVISQLAEAAAQDRTPLAFSWGDGCSWIRTPDGSLWSIHSGGGALVRDDRQRDWFKAHPGAAIAKECEQPAESLPTRPDPAVPTPYRWLDGGVTKVSINGHAYALPPLISERGAVLVAEASAGPTTPTGN